tara:strand:+ start:9646 stop:10200 length:555 start_codon:yes stop_codon:yes gene_type:complete
MKVQTLFEFGEERFLSELKYFDNLNFPGDRRNKDWFIRLPQIYKTRFCEWFFLVKDNNELVAFSTIQEFYPKCYRVLTRTYYDPKYRRKHTAYERTQKTPAMWMLDAQIKFLADYDTLFISMQDINRRKMLEQLRKKLGSDWILHPNMLQTCKEIQDKNCWQNIIYKGKTPDLPSITITRWCQM